MNRFRSLAAGVLAMLVLGLAPAAHAQDKVRVVILPFSESLGAVVADKQGYFKDEKLDVQFKIIGSGAEAMTLLQAGQVDIAFTNTVSTLQALEQGLQATLVAPGAVVRSKGPDSTFALIAKKGLLKSPKDLEGKTIATNIINSTNWLYDVMYLEKHGIDRSKVRFVELPFPQMGDALLSGRVDVIGPSEPFRTVLLDNANYEAFVEPMVDAQPNGDITQYVALTSWVQKNGDAANRFARAIRKAAAFANDPANEARLREINMQFTNLSPALKDRVKLPLFGPEVNVGEIRKTMELMLKYGVIKTPVDLTGHVMAVK